MVSGLWKPAMEREKWFSKILHRSMATSRVGGRQGNGTLALSMATEATFLARKISIENILLQMVEKKHECAYIDIWR